MGDTDGGMVGIGEDVGLRVFVGIEDGSYDGNLEGFFVGATVGTLDIDGAGDIVG